MYKLLTSSRGTDDLSICSDRDRNRRKRNMSNDKNIKGKLHVGFFLKDVFGFAEHMEKATYGHGYKLILTTNSESTVLNRNKATAIGKININSLNWYVPHYTASIDQERVLMKQIVDNIPTNSRYIERSVSMKEVKAQIFWTFELGTQEGINVPNWIIVRFQQREGQDSQNLADDTIYRPPVTSCQCNIGTERYSDSAILLNYDDDDYSQGCGQIEETFKALTKKDVLQPYIYLKRLLDLQMMVIRLDIIYSFLIYDIRKILIVLNQLK